MGKKKSNKKLLRKFLKRNRVVLAALTGTATGIAIANILGAEKAKQLVDTVEDSIKDFGTRLKAKGGKNSYRKKHESTPLEIVPTP